MARLWRSLVSVIALAAIALPCNAGYTIKSIVTRVTVQAGIVYINVNSDPTVDAPFAACATQTRYAFDGRTPEGKMFYTGLLSAYLTKVPVQIYGNGTCDADPSHSSETLTAFLTLSDWW